MSICNNNNVSWRLTPNFKKGSFTMNSEINKITGDNVFGIGKSKSKEGIESVMSFLEKSSNMEIFKHIEGGTVITSPPSKNDLVVKLYDYCKRAIGYYSNLPYDQIEVSDMWSRDAGVFVGSPLDTRIPRQKRVLSRGGKRFSSKIITIREAVIGIIKNSRGMLSESYVVSFLNSSLKCPECKSIGHIGWCDGMSQKSVDCFRDAVCMNCHNNGKITLFEIKTRWENIVSNGGNTTYAGSFAALNTLMTLNANIYLVIASRDTGDVRIGKITSAKMRGNHNWLYALQEGQHWGTPSSYVTCLGGLSKFSLKMIKLVDVMTDSFMNSIEIEVVKKLW
jgi:hypothetical protein